MKRSSAYLTFVLLSALPPLAWAQPAPAPGTPGNAAQPPAGTRVNGNGSPAPQGNNSTTSNSGATGSATHNNQQPQPQGTAPVVPGAPAGTIPGTPANAPGGG